MKRVTWKSLSPPLSFPRNLTEIFASAGMRACSNAFTVASNARSVWGSGLRTLIPEKSYIFFTEELKKNYCGNRYL